MKHAVDAVLIDKISMRESSARCDVPKSTLHDNISTLRKARGAKLFVKLSRFE